MDNNIIDKRTKGEWKYITMMNGSARVMSKRNYYIAAIHKEAFDKPSVNWEPEIEANAAFICKAVNNYDSLLEALKECSPLLDGLINRTASGTKRNELTDINIQVKNAIKKCEQ